MPEFQESGMGGVKTLLADLATRFKGESFLSRSIKNQRKPLERTFKESADDNQVRETQRMLQVIKYYASLAFFALPPQFFDLLLSSQKRILRDLSITLGGLYTHLLEFYIQ